MAYAILMFEGKGEVINIEALYNLNKELKEGKFKGLEGGEITFVDGKYFDIELEDYYRDFDYDNFEEFINKLSKVIIKGEVVIKLKDNYDEITGYIIKDGKVRKGHFEEVFVEEGEI